MKLATNKLMQAAAMLATAFFVTSSQLAMAQNYPAPPSFSPQQLDTLVARVALYPDPLLAQVLAAASFPDQIPDAARWADQYRNLRGDQLADAIYQAALPFDPAVQALIPFPTVLDMLAQDPDWTAALGNAVLANRDEVMDAVQRMRRSAQQYGYLQNNAQLRVVNQGPVVEIEPVDPEYVYVPVYNPLIVFAPPRPGFFVGAAIGFGPFCSIGAFGGWGWGGGFNWYNHSIVVNRVVWGRTWYNRDVYVHNYGNWDRGAWRTNLANRSYGFRPENGNRFVDARPPEQGFQNRGFERNDRAQFVNRDQQGFNRQGFVNRTPEVRNYQAPYATNRADIRPATPYRAPEFRGNPAPYTANRADIRPAAPYRAPEFRSNPAPYATNRADIRPATPYRAQEFRSNPAPYATNRADIRPATPYRAPEFRSNPAPYTANRADTRPATPYRAPEFRAPVQQHNEPPAHAYAAPRGHDGRR